MNKIEAMNVLGLSVLKTDLLKTAYKKGAFKYHPDRNPGGLEMMKAVNQAYKLLLEHIEKFGEGVDKQEGTGDEHFFGDKLNEAINAVINLEGVEIEICGNWIWLSGNTREHKDTIKAAGFFWASKKMMWYFRPAEWKSKGRGKFSMDEIRNMHGSQSIKSRPFKAVESEEV